MIRLALLSVSSCLCAAVALAEPVKLSVAGSVSATGKIQQTKEAPFFEGMGAATGLDITVEYGPIDQLDMDPEEALDLVQHNVVDIASLGIAVISRRDPFFLGLDIVGMATDYDTAAEVVAAYHAPMEAHLAETYNAHLLGVWPFGPQVLFCRDEIDGLTGLAGKRVRVYDANLGAVIEELGGTQMPIKFADVRQSLELDLIDCAITGPSSANTAGWVAESRTMLPLGFQIAFNAYAINLDRWRAFSADEQAAITAAFDSYISDVWRYSEALYDDALRCNIGATPCETVTPADLTEARVAKADLDRIRQSLTEVSLPAWLESCAITKPDCEAIWRGSVGTAIGLN